MKFVHSRFDDLPQDDWKVEDIAMWAARRIVNHEETCAMRWGVILRLMWAALAGIGSILVIIVGGWATHLFEVYDKLSNHG